MNSNGEVVVAGIFLLVTMAIAMVAVGLLEIPTFEPEAQPIQLLDILADDSNTGPAQIELLLQYTEDTEQGLTPEQPYHGITEQAQAQASLSSKIQAQSGACSRGY